VGSIDECDEVISMDYNTAWAPANDKFMRKLSLTNPDLTITLKYYEEGCGFAGIDVWKGGDKVSETYFESPDEAYYILCNDEFGAGYEKCECGAWNEVDWVDECHECEKKTNGTS